MTPANCGTLSMESLAQGIQVDTANSDAEDKMDETAQLAPFRRLRRSKGSRREESSDLSTQTIDLNSLFSEDAYSTGTFDLRSIESSSLGMLLDALPMPACLIDQWYTVVFSNQTWRRIMPDLGADHYPSFFDFLRRPVQLDKAKRLVAKAEKLLYKAFETRKPQQAEAIFNLEQRRMWCRLHLRAVRIRSQRHLLVLVEDITTERAQQRLAQREVDCLRKSLSELELRVRELTGRIGDADEVGVRGSAAEPSAADDTADFQ
jgi:hypothetical protein